MHHEVDIIEKKTCLTIFGASVHTKAAALAVNEIHSHKLPAVVHRCYRTQRMTQQESDTLMTKAFFFLTSVGCSSKLLSALARKV